MTEVNYVQARDGKYFYFAYASNMVRERILKKDPQATLYGPAKLDGYQLVFNFKSERWRGAMASIMESLEGHVWGVVWEKDISTIPILDEQEGVTQGIYQPVFVQVTTGTGKTLLCRSYQQSRPWEEDRRPSATYKNFILRGAKENSLPQDYIENHLETIVDNGYDGNVQDTLDLLHVMGDNTDKIMSQ